MSNDTKMIHNVLTDEITIIELTDDEQAERDAEAEAAAKAKLAKAAEAEAKAVAKAAAQAKLEALGLTVEDLQALGL